MSIVKPNLEQTVQFLADGAQQGVVIKKVLTQDNELGAAVSMDVGDYVYFNNSTSTQYEKGLYSISLNTSGSKTLLYLGEFPKAGPQGQKGDKGDTGAQGPMPTITIGDNGDWYINNVDTLKPSRGATGSMGPRGAGIGSLTSFKNVGDPSVTTGTTYDTYEASAQIKYTDHGTIIETDNIDFEYKVKHHDDYVLPTVLTNLANVIEVDGNEVTFIDTRNTKVSTSELKTLGNNDFVKPEGDEYPEVNYLKKLTVNDIEWEIPETDLSNYSTTAQMNAAIEAHHDSTKANLSGGNAFSGSQTIDLGSTDGAKLEVSGSGGDQSFLLTRSGGSQATLEAGGTLALFGTKTNHPLQLRTNYTNRLTVGTDGSVVLASDVSSSSNSNQVATTKWVNAKNYYNASNTPPYPVTSVNGNTGAITGLATSTDLQQGLATRQALLSTAQVNACNSGITSTKVSTYDGYASTIAGKSTVSGTNDGTNWTAITIDGTTKNIPAGGSGGGTTLYKHEVILGLANGESQTVIISKTATRIINRSTYQSVSTDAISAMKTFVWKSTVDVDKDYYPLFNEPLYIGHAGIELINVPCMTVDWNTEERMLEVINEDSIGGSITSYSDTVTQL